MAALLAAGCTGLPDGTQQGSDDGALRGELVTHILDFEDRSEMQHQLRLPNGELRPLLFSGEPELAPGSTLKVWGQAAGGSFVVSRFEREAPTVEAHRSALIMGKPKPTRRWAFVLVNFNGQGTLTKEMAQDRLFALTNPRSMKSYYREVSYGLQDLDGDVLGPFNIAPRNTCDTQGPVSTITPMIQGTYDQYLWYFGTRQTGCGWAGLASLGTADRPQRNSWYNASSGCVVLAQEPGHNFGMVHSSSMRCTNGGGTPVPIIASGGGTCVHSEYGNQFDPMGGGCFHMDGFQKAYQDWLTGCNVVKVTQSGTFTIFPLEKACNGVQLLQIPFGGARSIAMGGTTASLTSYYLELRAPIGIDGGLTPRVLVTVGGEIAESRGRGGRNWLLDMVPETTTKNDAALPVGKLYTDPGSGGPKFTVVSADSTKAVIRVELASGGGNPESPGAGTCDDGNAFTAPGPETCEAAPPPISSPADAGATPPRDGGRADAIAADSGAGGAGGGGGGGTGGTGGSAPVKQDAAPSTPPTTPDAAPGSGENPPPVTPPPVTPPTTSGGCGCRVAAPSNSPTALLAVVFFGAVFIVRRRRR
jgi:MYXO-CTERM domain-containing protein